tara:strand:- start:1511 stop:2086 length:576 start_codon:yes stop_codon:yes gene_type:complete
MLTGSQEIFPTKIFRYQLESHQDLKDKYLKDMIKSYEECRYDKPDGWVCDKVATSFNQKQIIKEVPDEYAKIVDELMDREWEGKFDFWHSVYKNGESQEVHHHLPAWWSGIHFLKFNKEEHKAPIFWDPARLAKGFSNSGAFSGLEKFVPEVREGDFIVFPSYLEHCVPAGYYNDYRVTIAVNLRVNQCSV